MPAETFTSEEDLDRLMKKIADGDMPNEEFSHLYHLAMAACIVFEGGSLEKVRQTILSLNEANKVEQTATGGYHETITVAWYQLIKAHLASLPQDTPRLLAVNSVLHEFTDKFVLLRHYSRDVLMSWDARKSYVEPDLAPLPEG